MNISSKQDGVYPRTPSALAQQYDFGKVFEEITGIQLTVEEQEAMMRAELSLKLGYDDNDQIVSMLNASANIITIKGNRLTIESDHFDLDADGTIHATAGVIGGCSIVGGVLKVPTANITGKLTADQIDTGSFTAKLEEIEDDVGTLQTNFTVLSGQIESKVSQTDFDTLNGTVSTHETRISQTEENITLKVSQTDFDTLGGIVSKISGELSLKIGENDKGKIVSMLNASADEIAIKGNRLTIESDNFILEDDGTVTASAFKLLGGELRDEIDTHAKDIGELKEIDAQFQLDLTGIKAESAQIRSDIKSLEELMSALRERIEEHDTLIGKLREDVDGLMAV